MCLALLVWSMIICHDDGGLHRRVFEYMTSMMSYIKVGKNPANSIFLFNPPDGKFLLFTSLLNFQVGGREEKSGLKVSHATLLQEEIFSE